MKMVSGKRDVKYSSKTITPPGGAFFLQAFSHAAIGLAIVDLDGHFIYTNPSYSKIVGYTAKELKNLTIKHLMYPEDEKANSVLRSKMLNGKIPGYIIEKRYQRKNGSLVWVKSSISFSTDEDGSPAYIIGLTEDIDEHHKAEEALKQSETRFRFMAEHMPPKVFTADAKGNIDYLSPQWVGYTGLEFKDMDYDGWSQVIHPDDIDGNMKLWEKSIATGKPFYFEHRLRQADGTYRWHVSRANAMRTNTGRVIKWIGSDTDIEELRQNRELKQRFKVLATQREQLITMNKSKDEFIMLASHQLRTPATGVKQFISMLLDGYAGKVSRQQRQLLETAYDCNERQLKMADDLLKVAQLDVQQISLSKAPCDLVELAQDVIAEHKETLFNRHQNIQFHYPKKRLIARLDGKLMYSVFENLLDNASKYSHQGKTIDIRLRRSRKNFIVDVKDDGVGISKKDQQKLFQKFSRIYNPLSDIVGGTGLGLYWAKKIVEMHGGTLEVVSKIKQGTTFTTRLPIA